MEWGAVQMCPGLDRGPQGSYTAYSRDRVVTMQYGDTYRIKGVHTRLWGGSYRREGSSYRALGHPNVLQGSYRKW